MKSRLSLSVLAAAAFLSTATLTPVLAAQSGMGMSGMGMSGMRGMGMSGMHGMGMGHGHGMMGGKGMKMGTMGKGMMGRMMMMQKMHKKMMSRMFLARDKPYSDDDVKRIIGGRMAKHGFSGLKAGAVKDAGDNAALVDIVSPKGEFLFRVKVNRKTGMSTIVE